MREKLLNKAVMVMYDIRGIQEYIFNTNKVRNIIGASLLVEGILENGLTHCEMKYPDIKMNKIYIGGGNACVMFETGQEASVINQALALWVQKETYSLQLAVAVVEKTDDYAYDYDALQKEMSRIKMQMPRSGLLGTLPIVEHEANTGYALSKYFNGQKVSTETYLKLCQYELRQIEENKIFDDMVDEKGKDSTLAVVHIDGNNMGKRIRHLMQNVENYTKAKEKMAKISDNINASFSNAFEKMQEKIEQHHNVLSTDKPYLRKIILAGDDITFVCTAKYAIPLVEAFVESLRGNVLYDEHDDFIKNIETNGFSVCAGIAFMHSHFPFSDAYMIAESCCQNAKQTAKQDVCKKNGIIGNWVDFQICKEVQSVYLHENREKNYRLADGKYLIRRPYYIPFNYESSEKFGAMDEKNKGLSLELLKEQIHYLLNDAKVSNLAKSDLKELRNTYPLGSDAMDELLTFLNSRNKKLMNDALAFDARGIANWYDALEIYELYEQV